VAEDSSGGWEEHLEELRRRVIYVLVVFFLSAAGAFALSEYIADFLMAPMSNLGASLYVFTPAEKFMTYLHISAMTGAVLTTPFFILQAGLFIWPALKESEKVYARFALIAFPSLFLLGSAVAYKFFAPVVLSFFLSFGGEEVKALWSFREYLSLLAGLMLAVGLTLQMPPILTVLFALGVVSPRKAASMRPHIALLIFFAAGVLTPPDVASQIMLGVPLYLLFEAALFAGRVITREKD
jgi:sec-independent protein translocase protein TatC